MIQAPKLMMARSHPHHIDRLYRNLEVGRQQHQMSEIPDHEAVQGPQMNEVLNRAVVQCHQTNKIRNLAAVQCHQTNEIRNREADQRHDKKVLHEIVDLEVIRCEVIVAPEKARAVVVVVAIQYEVIVGHGKVVAVAEAVAVNQEAEVDQEVGALCLVAGLF